MGLWVDKLTALRHEVQRNGGADGELGVSDEWESEEWW
jgi:hypothetical protein